MCKKCKKSNEFKVLSKILKKALKKIENKTGFVGHSVEPREKEPFLQDYPVGLEARKKEYMKVVIKGGIIKCDNRLFQNSNLVAGAIGYLDLVYLKFRPIGQEECHVYDVVELDTLSS